MKNPLIKPESTHYRVYDDESVELMEKMYGKDQMKIWAKITSMKYRLRIGKKDEASKDLVKIEDYDNYFKYLNEETHQSWRLPSFEEMELINSQIIKDSSKAPKRGFYFILNANLTFDISYFTPHGNLVTTDDIRFQGSCLVVRKTLQGLHVHFTSLIGTSTIKFFENKIMMIDFLKTDFTIKRLKNEN